MRVVIAPTDFSPLSENAVRYAADLAVSLGAELYLMHVCDFTFPADLPLEPYRRERLINEAKQKMAKLHREITGRTGCRIPIQVTMGEGRVVACIRTFCARKNPSFVVLSTHSQGSLERLLFGSVTAQALREIQWPLLIVPPAAVFRRFKRIGLACDFRHVEHSFPAKEIREMKTIFDASIQIVHVDPQYQEEYPSEVVEEATVLHDLLYDVRPSYHFVQGESVHQALGEFATANDLDLMIVVPRKHKLLDGIVRKSLSRALALKTPVPLLSIHQ